MAAWSQLQLQKLKPSPRALIVVKRIGQISSLIRLMLFLKLLLGAYRHVYAYGILGTGNQIYTGIKNIIVRIILKLPSSKAEMAKELAKTRSGLKASLAPDTFPEGIELNGTRSIPEQGHDIEWLRKEFTNLHKLDRGDVEGGRVSGAVYHGGQELSSIINEASANFVISNALHPDVFPGVRKMEAELVSMVVKLFHGDVTGACGTTTSGGTESIIMSVKTHRDWARATKGVKEPEMVVPVTAHAAFWKAAEYFCIKIHTVPVDPVTRQVDPKLMKRFINPNTIMIVGSAPNFPDGMIDRIPELGQLAKRYNVGLHVDCCLGSFIISFAERAGFTEGIPKFDFQVPGVTAISCDTHKYAFCPKGTSVIMYRSKELRRFQFFCKSDWSGGVYASPSIAGSRPGAVLAGAWAVVNHIGIDGYTESAKQIIGAARHFKGELKKRFAADLQVVGDPQLSVIAFSSKTLNIYAVGDRMSKKGWHLNALNQPAGLHMAFTRLTAASVDSLLDDLAAAIKEEKASPEAATGNLVALYGVGQTPAGPVVVEEVALSFLDILYE